MKIILPKASKGLKFDLVFTVDMNDFDVEMLLPSLFHLIRTKGRRVGKPVEPELYQEYLGRLAECDGVRGFTTHGARGLLDRWVRTSVVKMGRIGRSHAVGEQMMYLVPTTMLTYKAGLPKEITRLRGVHNFVYAVLLSQHSDAVKSTVFSGTHSAQVYFSKMESRSMVGLTVRLISTLKRCYPFDSLIN